EFAPGPVGARGSVALGPPACDPRRTKSPPASSALMACDAVRTRTGSGRTSWREQKSGVPPGTDAARALLIAVDHLLLDAQCSFVLSSLSGKRRAPQRPGVASKAP